MRLELFEKSVLILAKSHCMRGASCETCPAKINKLNEEVKEYICKKSKEEKYNV